jgi:hypothetical protein
MSETYSYEAGGSTYKFLASNPVIQAIKKELEKLPEWCKLGKLGSHEWLNTYNPDHEKGKRLVDDVRKVTILYPYQTCKHCHLRRTKSNGYSN